MSDPKRLAPWKIKLRDSVPVGPGPSVAKDMAKIKLRIERLHEQAKEYEEICPHPTDEREVVDRARHDTLGNYAGGYTLVRCRTCWKQLLKQEH